MYMHISSIIFFYIACTEGFDVKLKYCRFRCSKSCEKPEDKSNPVGTAKPPAAYYWRDFYGIIPPDAYPLGPASQYPQTYVGLVFDPSKNGTFITTIYDGLNYVYTALKNETTKINEHIQILCTKSPWQLSWFKLTSQNKKTLAGTHKNIRGGFHQELVDNIPKTINHYIVKTNKCHITYAGAAYTLNSQIEIALIDGSYDTTDDFLWLMYKEADETSEENPESCEPLDWKSSFKHHSEYKLQPDSIVPKFFEQISIGYCSITCSNEDKGSERKIAKDVKLSASMAYYWKPNAVISEEEALQAGEDNSGILYVGQAYNPLNIWDVGSSNLKKTLIYFGGANYEESSYYHVLSSNYPYQFKWVDTTTADFPKQNTDRMIPGGAYKDGAETFVCREIDRQSALPGSARVLTNGTYCYDVYGAVGNFQVLVFDPKNTI